MKKPVAPIRAELFVGRSSGCSDSGAYDPRAPRGRLDLVPACRKALLFPGLGAGLMGLLVLVGCSQQSTANAVTLVGTHDLALVGDLLFVTSTDRDELRVLDLVPKPMTTARDFVRAPNPLEPLSIPVLSKPAALSRDIHYENVTVGAVTTPLGREVAGPWVYATRAGGSEISVVAAGRDQLYEARLKPSSGLPEGGPARIPTAAPVTASAGFSEVAGASRVSHLFFSTSDGERATVLKIDLPGSPAELLLKTEADLRKQLTVGTFVGEVVVDMLVVPGIDGRSVCADPKAQCLILATRQQKGRAGRVILFDPNPPAGKPDLAELHFPGPVRSLAVHAGTLVGGTTLAPGQRVWAILDEEQCGGLQCSGVIAVDTMTGEVALDFKGVPMVPIVTGNAIPMGLTVAAGGTLLLPLSLLPSGGNLVHAFGALGVVTTSTGNVIFFNAETLTQLDTDQDVAVAAGVNLFSPDGGPDPQPYVEGPIADGGILLADGAWHTESISVRVNGILPGLGDLPTEDQDGTDFFAPSQFVAPVQVGDSIDALTPAGPCSRMTVAAVTSTSVRVAKVAAGCVNRKLFTVRAAGPNPYVLRASQNGFLGRSGPNQRFTFHGSYFEHFNDFDPKRPTLEISFGPGSPGIQEDWAWVIAVQSHFTPFVVSIDSTVVGCLAVLAGSVAYDLDRQRVFSVFPSANGIIELDPTSALPGLTSNAVCYR